VIAATPARFGEMSDAERIEKLTTELGELRRALDALNAQRDRDRGVVRDLIIPRVEELSRAVKSLAANDDIRNDAACKLADAYHELAQRLRKLESTVDLLFASDRTVQ
jgi:hypothetical protein